MVSQLFGWGWFEGSLDWDDEKFDIISYFCPVVSWTQHILDQGKGSSLTGVVRISFLLWCLVLDLFWQLVDHGDFYFRVSILVQVLGIPSVLIICVVVWVYIVSSFCLVCGSVG